MNAFPIVLAFIAVFMLLYFFGSYLLGFFQGIIRVAWDIVTSLFGYLISGVWYVILKILDIIIKLYWSLISSHPFIFFVCLAAVLITARLFSFRISYLWSLILAPVLSTIIGELLYGGISLNVNVTISDAGLLLASIASVFTLYYLFVKGRSNDGSVDSGSLIHKILNQSFIIVIVLMSGAFGIAVIDKLLPLLKQTS